MTLDVNSLFCRQCYAYCDETAEVTLTSSICMLSLTIKLQGTPSNFKRNFELPFWAPRISPAKSCPDFDIAARLGDNFRVPT